MQMSRLFTYSFDPNVGPFDRVEMGILDLVKPEPKRTRKILR